MARQSKSVTSEGPDGFSLEGLSVRASRPVNAAWKERLYGLEPGMGYHLDDLATRWGVSEETLRDKARRYGALRYVEKNPGVYLACIVHPATPKED